MNPTMNSIKTSTRNVFSARLAGRIAVQDAIFSLLVFLLAFGAVAWRLNMAPDLFSDEILYTRLGIRAAGEGALVWDSGKQIVIHPPLYFLAEGLFFKLTGGSRYPVLAPGDIFSAVTHARYYNALLAGLTALLLYWIGARLRGAPLGLLLAGLFFIDPFGVRINRRAMLETQAMLLSLAAFAIWMRDPGKGGRAYGRAIATGLLMGAALLTKELAFLLPLAVLAFGVSELLLHTGNGKASLLAGIMAFLTYLVFPMWVWFTGDWARFLRVKALALQRLLGLSQLSGWNRPGVSLGEFVLQRLVDYGPSYLLLAIGGAASLLVLTLGYRKRAGLLLGIWGIIVYPFFAFLTLFGSGNDQFFYFLLIPAILLTGYLFGELQISGSPLASWLASRSRRLPGLAQTTWSWLQKAGLAFILAVLLPVNLGLWTVRYGFGVDNGYHQLSAFVAENVPRGATINASGDELKFDYFFPNYQIASAGTLEKVQQEGIHYFVLAPKDVQAHYGEVTPELAQWLQANGKLLFKTYGSSYGEIDFYQVGQPSSATSTISTIDSGFTRSYEPARNAFIGSFLLMLALWLVVAASLAILWWDSKPRAKL